MVLDLIEKENLHILMEVMVEMLLFFGADLNILSFLIIKQKKMYSRNFTVDNKTFCLNLHYNGGNS